MGAKILVTEIHANGYYPIHLTLNHDPIAASPSECQILLMDKISSLKCNHLGYI